MVVLSIILVIAIPIIDKAEVTGSKKSIELYVRAVEQAVLAYKLEGNTDSPSFEQLEIEYDGDVHCEVSEVYLDKSVYLSDCYVNGNYVLNYTYGEKKYETVYFDVLKGHGCTQEEYEQSYNGTYYLNSSNGYTGVPTGSQIQNSCLKFYVLNHNYDTLDLMLDHNSTVGIAWNSEGANTLGPSESAMTNFANSTRLWNGIEAPGNYTLDQTESVSQANYTIDYAKYGCKARIITAQEIAKIVDAKDWNERTSTTSFYYNTGINTEYAFCKYGNTTDCEYGWIYDRTSLGCEGWGCSNKSNASYSSYWTATAIAGDTTQAWIVAQVPALHLQNVNSTGSGIGFRPVIKVLRSKVS